MQSSNIAQPEGPQAAPVLFGSVSINFPTAQQPDPVVSMDVTVSQIMPVPGTSVQSSAWAAPVSMRPCPVEIRSMRSVGGGEMAFAGFRPQLGPGLVFAGDEVLDSALQHAQHQVRRHGSSICMHNNDDW